MSCGNGCRFRKSTPRCWTSWVAGMMPWSPAFAVNAYVSEPRMTQDVDLVSVAARDLAAALRDHLAHRFRIAVRICEVARERGFRVYQDQKTGNRHLADLRAVETL